MPKGFQQLLRDEGWWSTRFPVPPGTFTWLAWTGDCWVKLHESWAQQIEDAIAESRNPVTIHHT